MHPVRNHVDSSRSIDAAADPWAVASTIVLLLFVAAFAFLIAHGRHPVAKRTQTPIVAPSASSPLLAATATPDPSAPPVSSGGPAPVNPANLPNTGPVVAASAAPSSRPATHPAPKPTAAPRPTATDHPPTAILNITPSGGQHPLVVSADASFSWDGDSTGIASYQFLWGDGLSNPASSSPTASHPYLQPGQYTITVIVTDTAGLSSSASRVVTVN